MLRCYRCVIRIYGRGLFIGANPFVLLIAILEPAHSIRIFRCNDFCTCPASTCPTGTNSPGAPHSPTTPTSTYGDDDDIPDFTAANDVPSSHAAAATTWVPNSAE